MLSQEGAFDPTMYSSVSRSRHFWMQRAQQRQGKQITEVGMAVKDAHRALGYALEDVIGELVKSGEMDNIFARYSVDYLKPEHYRVQ